MRPKSFRGVEHHLLHHARALHGLPLSKIDRRAVAAVIASVAETAGGVTGNRVRGSLSAFFSWCLANGLLDANPIVGTAKPHTEVSRDRVLDARELAAIWHAAGDDTYGSIIKVLAVTGARASEIGGLMWSEVDLDKGVASLPPERTKTARAHTIFLSAPAREILAAQPRRFRSDGTPSPWVFGTRGPFNHWAVCKKNLDRRIAEMTGQPRVPWRTHDLRRSCATLMATELGIEPFVIEAVLGHVSGTRTVARILQSIGLFDGAPRRDRSMGRLAGRDRHRSAEQRRHAADGVTPMRHGFVSDIVERLDIEEGEVRQIVTHLQALERPLWGNAAENLEHFKTFSRWIDRVVILSTAHPAKFPDAVEAACGVRPALPDWLSDLNDRPERQTMIAADQAAVEKFIAGVSRAAQGAAA